MIEKGAEKFCRGLTAQYRIGALASVIPFRPCNKLMTLSDSTQVMKVQRYA